MLRHRFGGVVDGVDANHTAIFISYRRPLAVLIAGAMRCSSVSDGDSHLCDSVAPWWGRLLPASVQRRRGQNRGRLRGIFHHGLFSARSGCRSCRHRARRDPPAGALARLLLTWSKPPPAGNRQFFHPITGCLLSGSTWGAGLLLMLHLITGIGLCLGVLIRASFRYRMEHTRWVMRSPFTSRPQRIDAFASFCGKPASRRHRS